MAGSWAYPCDNKKPHTAHVFEVLEPRGLASGGGVGWDKVSCPGVKGEILMAVKQDVQEAIKELLKHAFANSTDLEAKDFSAVEGIIGEFRSSESGGYYHISLKAITTDNLIVEIEDKNRTYQQIWSVGLNFTQL